MAASARNVRPGVTEKISSQVDPLSALGNGRSQPPSQGVTAIENTAIIAEYSPTKKNARGEPLYSVWKPAVNSDSASGKSKGARFVSATIAMAKITNAISPSGK